MTQGAGLVGLLYALKGLVQDFAIMIITGAAMIAFFWLIFVFLANKLGWFTGGNSWYSGSKIKPNQIMYGLFILFVILAVYSLIALTAAIFGVNSSPSGGLLVQ